MWSLLCSIPGLKGLYSQKDYVLNFRLKNVYQRFTPTLGDIELAEKYLLSNGKSTHYNGLNGIFTPERPKAELKTYKRQYFGYLNEQKDSIIFVQLLNFKHKRIAKAAFDGWQRDFLLGFDGFYERNTFRITINISKDEVSIY